MNILVNKPDWLGNRAEPNSHTRSVRGMACQASSHHGHCLDVIQSLREKGTLMVRVLFQYQINGKSLTISSKPKQLNLLFCIKDK